jgi:hypothetical protein
MLFGLVEHMTNSLAKKTFREKAENNTPFYKKNEDRIILTVCMIPVP